MADGAADGAAAAFVLSSPFHAAHSGNVTYSFAVMAGLGFEPTVRWMMTSTSATITFNDNIL